MAARSSRVIDALEVFGFAAARFFLTRALAAARSLVDLSFFSLFANPLLLAAVWLGVLKARRQRWAAYGLYRPRPLLRYVGYGVLLFLVIVGLQRFGDPVLDALARAVGGDPAAHGRQYAHLEGNLGATLGMVALVWLFAAIGEEVFFRGLLFTKLASVLGDGRAAWAVAWLLQALIFGLQHQGSGTAAVVNSTVSGLIYGAAFLLWKRNLLPVVLAHGLWDTFGLTMLYFGRG
jgi:hypothetical protein